jgi:Domain of unknown function (DUF1840)
MVWQGLFPVIDQGLRENGRMSITFKSKAAADVLMLDAHAKALIKAMGKDGDGDHAARGIVTADQTSAAMAGIEAAIAAEVVQREALKKQALADGKPEPVFDPVTLRHRATPLLAMLRAAQAQKLEVVWGV